MKQASIVDKFRANRFGMGYWISPSGTVMPVDQNHINTVIKNPRKFNISDDQIKEEYEKTGEPLGSEGKAREVIILSLIRRGWIRVRNYGNQGWSLNVHKLDDRTKNKITDFFFKLFPDGGWDDVKIDHPYGVERMEVNDILHFKLFKSEKTAADVDCLTFVSSVDAFDGE